MKEDYRRESGGVIFPNPNAPTAIYEELDFVEDILAHHPDEVVIVDEAYIDFAGRSALELLGRYNNLIVVRTFSKARSMAGMRIGYAVSNPSLIRYLNDVKYSFNSYTMNLAAIQIGAAAVEDEQYFRETTEKIIATRERVKGELGALGFSFPDSRSNFIFATHPRLPARELFEALREEHIYVRFFDKPRIRDYLRITIGTDQEMDIFLAFVRDYSAKRL